jgi:hypothetical protein
MDIKEKFGESIRTVMIILSLICFGKICTIDVCAVSDNYAVIKVFQIIDYPTLNIRSSPDASSPDNIMLLSPIGLLSI